MSNPPEAQNPGQVPSAQKQTECSQPPGALFSPVSSALCGPSSASAGIPFQGQTSLGLMWHFRRPLVVLLPFALGGGGEKLLCSQ